MQRRQFLAHTTALATLAVSSSHFPTRLPAHAQDLSQVRPPSREAKVTPLVEGLSHPWAIGLLPDGAGLISERPGALSLVDNLTKSTGTLRPIRISGLPTIKAAGQGGLLDIQPLPDFATSGEVVFAATIPDLTRRIGTEIFRAKLSGSRLTNVSSIFSCQPKSRRQRHFGCRIRFDQAQNLVFALGDNGKPERARDLSDDAGKVHRITKDGAPALGNPYLGAGGKVRETIYASGTRNAQGMAVHPYTGAIWFHEHGPRGGDEVNLLEAGADYGWPHTTHGRAYTGGKIGVGAEAPGIEAPLWVWVPSIAPSGMDFWLTENNTQGSISQNEWGDGLFVGALAGRSLVRLVLSPQTETETASEFVSPILYEERYLQDISDRIREVRTLHENDGRTARALLLLTDVDKRGACLRVNF